MSYQELQRSSIPPPFRCRCAAFGADSGPLMLCASYMCEQLGAWNPMLIMWCSAHLCCCSCAEQDESLVG